MSNLSELVAPWLQHSDSDDLIKLHDQLIWLQRELFDDYEPNRYESFDDRLAEWLQNVVDDEDRKTLFRLLEHLFFVGKQQFDSLCRAAFGDQTVRWIIDGCGIDISLATASSEIDSAVERTWFCPITDSMRINSFLKLNGLAGHDHRPDWRSLREFGAVDQVRQYVTNHNIERLVLLEDFVGSGTQISSTVHWAATALPATSILVVPLVCCPGGVITGETLAASHMNLTFSPTLTLRSELFLHDTPQANEPALFARVRKIVHDVRARLGAYEHHPFGFEATGALVAMYSNCPDNTLPIIHHKESSWTPLFSRIRRS